MIREARQEDVEIIKNLVDGTLEMDADEDTFPEDFYERLMDEGVILVHEEEGDVMGAVFGTYSEEEGWADIVGLVTHPETSDESAASDLAREFEGALPAPVMSIDVYADPSEKELYSNLGYREGRKYVSFRKKL